jgi:hypothetical protein
MSVVLIRGTSGSGKTWIAEQVIAKCGGVATAQTVKLGDPIKPYEKWKTGAYVWKVPPVTVMGRYDATCGGCDTLSWKGAADVVEEFVVDQVRQGQSVLLEGLMVSSYGVERLKRIPGLTVVYLTTPLETCLDGVNQRRIARGAKKPLNEHNTRAKHHTLLVTNKSNKMAGVKVEPLDRPAAHARVMELLGL